MQIIYPRRKDTHYQTGFTLVELLTVIAVIGVLAGLIVAVLANTTGAKERAQTRSQMAEIQLALDAYKGTFGSFPSTDNSNASNFNPLFYELTGVTYIPDPTNPSDPTLSKYRSKYDPANELGMAQVRNVFGSAKAGFGNSTGANAFLTLRPDQVVKQNIVGTDPTHSADCYLLKVPARRTDPSSPIQYNFWHYKFQDPNGYNPNGYDLWAKLRGNKVGETITIGNWNTR